MAFDPDAYLSKSSGFDPDAYLAGKEEKTIGGAIKNAASDVIDSVKGLKDLAVETIKHPIDTPVSVVKNIPSAIIEEGKRLGIGKTFTEGPVAGLKQFGQALYDKPVSTALTVLPAAGAATKLGKLSRGANLLEDASTVGRLSETAASLGNKIPKALKEPLSQVGTFLSDKYAKVSKRPGWANTLADYAEENARNLATRSAGASYGQLNKLGEKTTQALQDLMLERGIVSPKVGSLGAKDMVKNFKETAGKTIGETRKMAASRGALHDMDQVINQIKANLDPIYTQGMKSGQKGSYLKGLAELKKLDPNPEKIADTISDMFREARRQDPLRQPAGPLADIARQLREINENKISKVLKPEEVKAYQDALGEYGAMKQIGEFYKRKNLRDASGRLGPGSGLFRQAVQSFFDTIGYRGQAQISKKFAEYLRKNPDIASNPKAMFQKYIDETVEAIDEIGDVGQ